MKPILLWVMTGLVYLFLMNPARATFTPITDIFAGTNTSGTTITATASVLSGGSTTTSIGPGFTGTVSLGSGAVYTLQMDLNTSNSGELVLSGSGLLGLGGTFDANKTFTGDSLDPSTGYALTLGIANNSLLSLVSGLTLTIKSGSTVVDSLNQSQLTTLFSGGTSALTTFTTSSGLTPGQNLSIDISGNTGVGLLGSSITFTSGSLALVPEPPVNGMMAMGLLAVAALAARRRMIAV